MKKIVFTLLGLVVFAACKKDDGPPSPVVDFTATDDGFGAVQFVATATNATSYLWDFGDGRSDSTSATPLHAYRRNGTFNVFLKATGPGGSTVINKLVPVTGVRGSAMFWKASGTRSLEISVDGQYVGVVITNHPRALTTCGAAGTATVERLKPGVYRYVAKEQGGLLPRTYEGSFSVTAGECTPVQVPAAR